ncbi:MAG TPA: flagellar export chaperone FliS [Thiotrichales bacterium]|nr:MAG: flagellar export chaperone FliS [Thiotrichales bacterium 35-46-9]OYZ04148.1 MAG: flagellar export chaperone FliS [Thiotrichales bacterium 16-46-22]OYZ41378.1 MAG: flagellar export chaperone FliS [Thiotrichales bacterium 24-47-4]OZA15927.1 MAG: flagellar export chaperone FliS [Thiotrichales bacterium 17-46-47]HQR82722.1 flagellar export chaperone FliS [Thiotrichales bacterium]
MHAMTRQRFLQQYTNTNVQTAVESATPHRLVQMLYEGALDRIAQAKGAMMRKDFEAKARLTNRVIDILSSLRAGLDLEKGGDVASNLEALYGFMIEQVYKASRHNSPDMLEETAEILRTVKAGWDEMPEEFRKMRKEQIDRLAA